MAAMAITLIRDLVHRRQHGEDSCADKARARMRQQRHFESAALTIEPPWIQGTRLRIDAGQSNVGNLALDFRRERRSS